MKNKFVHAVSYATLVATMLLLPGCDNEDPEPVNEEEVITTVTVTLTPLTGSVVTLRYFDADGDAGSAQPEITVSGPLAANMMYTGSVEFLNETESPAEDVTEEIVEEADEHLLCYEVEGITLTVVATDEDSEGRPLGLTTQWQAGAAGTGSVTVLLRHQPGTKTGDCPGGGDTDVEVTFPLTIQ